MMKFNKYSALYFTLTISAITALMLFGCRTIKETDTERQKDSIRTEVITQILEKIDTVYVKVPGGRATNKTIDTISTLEIATAISTAIVEGDVLHHTLYSKDIEIPVKVVTKEKVRDSIVYRDQYIYNDRSVTKEVNRLTKWQKFQQRGFWVLIIFDVLLLVFLILSKKLRK